MQQILLRFRDLQNYTTLKLLYKFKEMINGFRDLQNYTTLKRSSYHLNYFNCFRDLQNYTTLKPEQPTGYVVTGFTELHYSQTVNTSDK